MTAVLYRYLEIELGEMIAFPQSEWNRANERLCVKTQRRFFLSNEKEV